jgi:hypothetical protein
MDGRRYLTASLLLCILIVGVPCVACAKIIYVDAAASAAGNGSSWQTAYQYLQDALTDVSVSEQCLEIHVAEGLYRPDQGPNLVAGDRYAVFRLPGDVTLRGGYAGFGAPDPNLWDPNVHRTVLTGDLAGNDLPVTDPRYLHEDPSRSDNSACVAMVEQAGSDLLIEGITVTGAYWDWERDAGHTSAGLYVRKRTDITIRNCTFTANAASGLDCFQCTATIVDCVFRGNGCDGGSGGALLFGGKYHILRCTFDRNWARAGGGIYAFDTYLWMEECVFSRNTIDMMTDGGLGGGLYASAWAHGSKLLRCQFYENAAPEGGAINLGGGTAIVPSRIPKSMLLQDCTFRGNRAYNGGALCVHAAEFDFLGCRFSQNTASDGGAVSNRSAGTNFTECLFSANTALCSGACVYAHGTKNFVTRGGVKTRYDFDVTLTNCTLTANIAPEGRTITCSSWDSADIDTTLIGNCILDNGPSEICNPRGSQIEICFSDVRGGADSVYDPCQSVLWGQGNLDVAPLFADPGYWDPNGTLEDPNDDFFVEGDYHLKSQAGRWDPAAGSWVVDDVTSPCIDAGDPNSPIGEEPFPNGGRANLGAYGGTTEASKSYFDGPVCTTIIAGDINGDGRVDAKDLAILARHWLQEQGQ